ncbi:MULTISPECIES: hypothetical protein [unclassified Mycobacterium]|uniref:hypothetical protein n=1 Tax=unclassified Mycobacterium TaxID=2642494 RepID=UPI0029C879E9|nr:MULTISPECIES: hypothetical protein [unclassified Mycobacterium]
MSTLPRFVPAEEPSTYTSGKGLVLLAEFSRPVTITCEACHVSTLRLKLLSNSALNADTCDRLLTAYLDELGWTRLRERGADICPECAGTRVEVCDFCRLYTGGHTKTCPTQLPGVLQ